jgi:sodium/proline symporter
VELLAFLIYLIIVVAIGVILFFKMRGGDDEDYFLGGRKMGSWVTAISASASDMSAWLLMGLPGSILAAGVGKLWIAFGLLIGTVMNWQLVAPRLRLFSQAANDSITIPQYLSNRFMAKSKTLQIVSAVVFLVCYAVYAASSLKACGILFNTVLGMDVTLATLLSAAIILLYTFLGGFAAVCWTDFIQGMMILAALLIAPIAALSAIKSGAVTGTPILADHYWSFLPSGKMDWASLSTILSELAWGLGYFGMPHILVRFMSIEKPTMVRKSKWIAAVWITITLSAAVTVGLVGRFYLPGLTNADSSLVFIYMVRGLFPAFLAGVLLSAVLAASMSTADSQLLVSASAFASDVYKPVFRKEASNSEMMWVGRIVVTLITVAAFFIAIDPNSGGIMELVQNAWAGFGSSFGVVILMSLFWRRFTYRGAVAGILAGAVTDFLWFMFLTNVTGIYEIIPGFIMSALFAAIFALTDKKEVADAAATSFDKLSVNGE